MILGGMMKSRMMISLAMASVSLIFAAGCSTPVAKKKSAEETKTSSKVEGPAVPGTHYTTVVFPKGKSSLDSMSKEYLKELAAKAHKTKKPIEEIRILAWSDNEYPDKVKGKSSQKDVKLANERAQKIKDYLEQDLKELEDIDAYNMAQRPNLMSKLFQNDEYEVKEAFESSGATGSKLPDGSVSYTKAQKALVIIDYQGDADNLK
jgi:hypothetical protein